MIPCQRHLFDIPDDVAYLNCAYMSPLMRSAVDAGTAALARKAHPWEITPDKFFTGSDEFRATAAQVLGCSADDVAIVPSASYGIATAARNLPVKKGQSILVLAEQFPSNYYPWQRLAEGTGGRLKIVAWPKTTTGLRRFSIPSLPTWRLPRFRRCSGRAAVGLISSALAKLAARLAPHSCSTSRSRSGHSPSAWATCRMACSQISPSLPATSGCSALFRGVSLRRAQMAERGSAGRELDSARQRPRFLKPDFVHGELRQGREAFRYGRAIELRAAAGGGPRHEATAGVGRRRDFTHSRRV